MTPGGLWDANKFEIWGHWLYGEETASEKINLNYAGKPSLFEVRTIPPAGSGEVKLRVLAVDQAGNSGQHMLSFRVVP